METVSTCIVFKSGGKFKRFGLSNYASWEVVCTLTSVFPVHMIHIKIITLRTPFYRVKYIISASRTTGCCLLFIRECTMEYVGECNVQYRQRCWKHLESGEATLSSRAGPRCGCKAIGLCMRSQIMYIMVLKTFYYEKKW